MVGVTTLEFSEIGGGGGGRRWSSVVGAPLNVLSVKNGGNERGKGKGERVSLYATLFFFFFLIIKTTSFSADVIMTSAVVQIVVRELLCL